MGKFTNANLGMQDIDYTLERDSIQELMQMKKSAANVDPSGVKADIANMEPGLPSPSGNSTGSISTANNTNSVISSDAHSISSGSDMTESNSKADPDLLAQIKYQVEFYFSQQNLARDAYMQERMDEDGYIPIAIIANFKQVQKLTNSKELILQAITNSTICTINDAGDKIKASWKRPARTTIIIREAEETVTEEDIKELFSDTQYKINSVRSDVAQTWFVTMESEEDAKQALLYIIDKELKGQRIKARLKSETLPAPAPAPPIYPINDGGPVSFGGQPGPQQYYGGYPMPQANMNYNMLSYGQNAMPQWNPNVAYPNYEQAGVPNADASSMQLMVNGQQPMIAHEGNGLMKQPQKGQRLRGDNTNRRRSNGGEMNQSGKGVVPGGSKKKKGPVKRRIKTPVFQAYDFPSLPMGKISLDDEEAPKEKEMEILTKPTEPTSTSPPAKSLRGSSWAAAVAKAPSPPPVKTVTPPPETSTKPGQTKATNRNQKSNPSTQGRAQPFREQAQIAKEPISRESPKARGKLSQFTPVKETVQHPSRPRPKRGWEKPGLKPINPSVEKNFEVSNNGKASRETAKVDTKHEEKNEAGPALPAVDTIENFVTNKENDKKEDVKPVSGWGSKKSFADIIKSKAETAATTATPGSTSGKANPTPKQSSQHELTKTVSVKAATSNGFGRTHGSSIDGDWRSKAGSKGYQDGR